MKTVFPFTAIVGQDEMINAIVIAAIEPRLSGVLIFGDRGTGKSTAVRALAALLPEIETVSGCAYGCDPADVDAFCVSCNAAHAQGAMSVERRKIPVVDLPLGATEDRVVGALNLERALADGAKVFEPGLLARAHRGFLYIDEVNLLEDHIVDLLLDVAASGAVCADWFRQSGRGRVAAAIAGPVWPVRGCENAHGYCDPNRGGEAARCVRP
jgi:magnesium chelatase subunit I